MHRPAGHREVLVIAHADTRMVRVTARGAGGTAHIDFTPAEIRALVTALKRAGHKAEYGTGGVMLKVAA